MNEPTPPDDASKVSGKSSLISGTRPMADPGEASDDTAFARFIGGYFMGSVTGFLAILQSESLFGHAVVVGLMTGLLLGSSCALFGKGFLKFVFAVLTYGGIY